MYGGYVFLIKNWVIFIENGIEYFKLDYCEYFRLFS